MVKLPESMPYPTIPELKDVPMLRERFCYVIKEYSHNGIGLLILRKNGEVFIKLSDFDGNILNAASLGLYEESANTIMREYAPKILQMMQTINLSQAQYYFSKCESGPTLVDIRITLNKFTGPGYITDFFGRIGLPIQESIGKPLYLNKENIKKISSGNGTYEYGRFILKPSAFKFMMYKDQVIPSYGIIRHEA